MSQFEVEICGGEAILPQWPGLIKEKQYEDKLKKLLRIKWRKNYHV
jgi:hypothetical protein